MIVLLWVEHKRCRQRREESPCTGYFYKQIAWKESVLRAVLGSWQHSSLFPTSVGHCFPICPRSRHGLRHSVVPCPSAVPGALLVQTWHWAAAHFFPGALPNLWAFSRLHYATYPISLIYWVSSQPEVILHLCLFALCSKAQNLLYQQPLALCFGFALETSGLILKQTFRVLFSDLFHCPSCTCCLGSRYIQPVLEIPPFLPSVFETARGKWAFMEHCLTQILADDWNDQWELHNQVPLHRQQGKIAKNETFPKHSMTYASTRN